MRRRLGILLITLAVLGAMQCKHGRPAADSIPPGLDTFRTDPDGTEVRFDDAFTIPAGFFDRDSAPFTGAISLAGSSLGTYRGRPTTADTVIERKGTAKLSRGYAAEIPIEVAALSLRSVQPIRVQTGGGAQSWDVKVGLSPSRRSEGRMMITGDGRKGGTFSSEFVVYPLYTFTRQSDGAQKQLDVGRLELPPQAIAAMTMRADNVQWATTATNNFAIGGGVSNLQVIQHNSPKHRHRVIYTEPLLAF